MRSLRHLPAGSRRPVYLPEAVIIPPRSDADVALDDQSVVPPPRPPPPYQDNRRKMLRVKTLSLEVSLRFPDRKSSYSEQNRECKVDFPPCPRPDRKFDCFQVNTSKIALFVRDHYSWTTIYRNETLALQGNGSAALQCDLLLN
ncbi:hypothetical protein ABEB36_012366 [Hypothenemus hampei]|uniref:Uncharacterized protein n=1 Tax=Hypothenemus hampei TaxID=57062 RepID=A0ABD1EFB1_HYPHA